MKTLCSNCSNQLIKGEIQISVDEKLSEIPSRTENFRFCVYRNICMNNLIVKSCSNYDTRKFQQQPERLHSISEG
jgi:hypothetical protein